MMDYLNHRLNEADKINVLDIGTGITYLEIDFHLLS